MPERASVLRRAIILAVTVYFVLVLIAEVAGGPALLTTASEVLFGLIAIGLGVALVWQESAEKRLPYLAAWILGLGGVAQLGWVGTAEPILGGVATLAILLGVLIYVVVIWRDRR